MFTVAAELGWSVTRLAREMTNAEFGAWVAFLNERARRAERAREG